MNESVILEGLKSGQETAFRQFFETYYDSLILFANHILNDAEVAEDVVQECFVDFWVHKRYAGISSGLDKYIFQAVKHAALNYLRGDRRRARRQFEAMSHMQEAHDALADDFDEQLELLYAAINRLPEERKKIFILICLEGKKYQEVADLLQISINTVKTQMARSFHFLREAAGKQKFSLLLLEILFIKRK